MANCAFEYTLPIYGKSYNDIKFVLSGMAPSSHFELSMSYRYYGSQVANGIDDLGTYYSDGEITRRIYIPVDGEGDSVWFNAVYYGDGSIESYHTPIINVVKNIPPTAVFNIDGVSPGSSANIKWTYRSSDGDQVITKSLVRYYQAKNSSIWQTLSLNVQQGSVSAVDNIPSDFNGGTIYYVLKFEDVHGASGELQSSYYALNIDNKPSLPAFIQYPNEVIPLTGSLSGGESGAEFDITWGASTDVDGNIAGYEVDRQYNNLGWTNVYRANNPNQRTITQYVQYGYDTVRYRVRAYDASGLYSDYRIGNYAAIVNSLPPSVPPSITVPNNIAVGQSYVVKWGQSTDPEGGAVTYLLQRSIDSGNYTAVAQTASRSFTDEASEDWQTVRYRVKAKDARGYSSSYKESPVRTITKNHPPTITCEYTDGQELEPQATVFSIDYSVNDSDLSDTLTVKEYLDSTEIRSFVATRETTYQFDFLSGAKWDTAVNGEHSITISVTDGTSTKRLTVHFLKVSTGCSITLTEPITITDTIKYVVLSISFTLPYDGLWADGVFDPEVFNSAFTHIEAKASTSGAWEDCRIDTETSYTEDGNIFSQGDNILIAMREGHVMMIHKFTTTGSSLNYRIIANSNNADDLGHICSVQGVIGTNDITLS